MPGPREGRYRLLRATDVLPQKSTKIYPKATTGLVINPLEG
jgi:uncharacterized protein (DUF1015 family)